MLTVDSRTREWDTLWCFKILRRGVLTPGVVRCRLRAPYSCPHRHEPKEEFSCELEMSTCGQVRLTGLLFGILLGCVCKR